MNKDTDLDSIIKEIRTTQQLVYLFILIRKKQNRIKEKGTKLRGASKVETKNYNKKRGTKKKKNTGD
jgi:hypothetical protein